MRFQDVQADLAQLFAIFLQAGQHAEGFGHLVEAVSGGVRLASRLLLLRALEKAAGSRRFGARSSRHRTRVLSQRGSQHTRLPGYAQEKVGIVEYCYPAMPLPDAHAEGRDEDDYVYAVSFAASDLWPDGDPVSRVSVDVFENYISAEDD